MGTPAWDIQLYRLSNLIQIRYMRSDSHTINGITCYKLGTLNTSSFLQAGHSTGLNLTHDWGIRAYVRHADGSEAEITSGTPVAIVSRNANGEGIQSATWVCPETDLVSTDAIRIEIWARFSGFAWSQLVFPGFITEQLSGHKLNGSTWTVYYWTSWNWTGSQTDTYFKWGDSTRNSRIENISFNSCNSITTTSLQNQNEIISIKSTQTVAGVVGEAELEIDNEPAKDIRAGDFIVIQVGPNPSSLAKVFTGEIYDVGKESNDEEKLLRIKAKDFSLLFLVDKFTKSYLIATNARDIVLDIVQNYVPQIYGTVCEKKISSAGVEVTVKTRQIDFVGEPLLDSLNKISQITEHDWYVDEEKVLQWFLRNSRTSSGKAYLDRNDLEDYSVTDPWENLCNKAFVYGKDNKSIPWDRDIWTEPVVDPPPNWTGLEGCSVSKAPAPGDPEIPKAGVTMVKIGNPVTDWLSWDQSEGWGMTCLRPAGCYFEFIMVFPCPSNKEIIFRLTGANHSGGGNVTAYYKFASTPDEGFYIQLGASWSGGYQTRCPPLGACPSSETGPTNKNLYVKWTLFVPWLQTGAFNTFHVEYKYTGALQKLKGRFTLPIADFPDGIDLEPKQAPRKLLFVIGSKISAITTEKAQLNVLLKFKDGHTATYRAEFFGIVKNQWSTIEIPVGPEASTDGWTGDPIGKVEYIEFEFLIDALDPTDYILIDWLHFDEAKWFGLYEDVTSQNQYGLKFKEIFDDTLYSDEAALRRAKEWINKFKDPISTIKDIIADLDEQNQFNPGETIIIAAYDPSGPLIPVPPNYVGPTGLPELVDPVTGLPIPVALRTYRMDTITHKITEDLEYYAYLILSLDPQVWEGTIQTVSERVRRLEQRSQREPAAPTAEVD